MNQDQRVHPCNLRSSTEAQRRAIEETEAAFASERDDDLALVKTLSGSALYPDTEPGLAVEFIYTRKDYPEGQTGLEVTVFADDGSVIDSQDFG